MPHSHVLPAVLQAELEQHWKDCLESLVKEHHRFITNLPCAKCGGIEGNDATFVFCGRCNKMCFHVGCLDYLDSGARAELALALADPARSAAVVFVGPCCQERQQ